MASTYSDLKIELIGTGEQTGTWGTTTNNNFSVAFQEAITGSADVPFSSADVTLILTDTNAAQTARNLRLNLTGTSGGARQLILGSGCQIEKLYIVNNGLADTVTIKNTTGNGVAVPAGKTMFVFNNGTNVLDVTTHLSSLTLGTALGVTSGGTGITAVSQGDILYGSAANTIQVLNKNTTASRYLSNSGTSNNPAWAQVDLTNGVTGILPSTNGGTSNGFFAVSGPASTTKTMTFPNANTTIVGTDTVQTLTNKALLPRVSSTTSITSPLAWNSDNFDQYVATAQAGALTINADAGTPVDGEKQIFRFKDNGTAQGLTWTTGVSKGFRAIGVTLPTTTVINKTVYVGCIYNAADDRWDAVAVAQEA